MVGDKADRAKGQVKEKAGRATGNAELAERGRADQSKGELKKSGKKLVKSGKSLKKAIDKS
jgi:uncharacterized protein YjbJ (UPF0337 family)